MWLSMFDSSPISSSISKTALLAPPWRGPLRVPMAEAMAEYISLMVEAVTMAENVDAFISCSAWRVMATSNTLVWSSVGSSPVRV